VLTEIDDTQGFCSVIVICVVALSVVALSGNAVRYNAGRRMKSYCHRNVPSLSFHGK